MIELTMGELIASLSVLFLSVFLGFELISKVPPTLHTPLMSGANAISGIAIVGALMAANARLEGGDQTAAALLGTGALVLAAINCVGGFMVTGRMLAMFKNKKRNG
jgi:NAD(P) transhydrogenase subunit alpha